jgi:BirA family transcriptional regulator, biotin operon repressor / biotin---[acetyl-CoA-carboxylase] ligase
MDINGATCVAEAQSGGRGRRGRSWVTTPYCNLMLSMAWRFPGGPGLVSGLSLAAGVALLRALEQYGVSGAGLKWPNDVLWDNRKLAGLLVDVQGEAAGPTLVILGVGINGYISPQDAAHIDQPWIDLQGITRRRPPTAIAWRRWSCAVCWTCFICLRPGALRRFARNGRSGICSMASACA